LVPIVAIAMIKIDTAKLDRAIAAAFEETAKELNDSFHQSIIDPKWKWDRVTVRRSGEVAGSPRNIVDLGTLRDSQDFKITANKVLYTWNVPYSLYVQYGYTTKSGTVVAGRDWVEDGLSAIDLGKVFAKKLRSKLK